MRLVERYARSGLVSEGGGSARRQVHKVGLRVRGNRPKGQIDVQEYQDALQLRAAGNAGGNPRRLVGRFCAARVGAQRMAPGIGPVIRKK